MATIRYKAYFSVATIAMLLLSAGVCFSAPLDDNAIVAATKNSHVFKTYLKNDHITVTSRSGVVTLKGSVPEESHKLLAQETVANVPGVKRINNQLRIQKTNPASNPDSLLARRVKSMLRFHSNVNPSDVKISVKNGVVTLEGEADSQAQKELTEEYIGDLKDVKEVKNKMIVRGSSEKPKKTIYDFIDDASITSQINTELFFHKSTSVLRTKVETKDGVVTLSGKAKNAAEKDLVAKFANDIEGVKKVTNNITVEEAANGNSVNDEIRKIKK